MYVRMKRTPASYGAPLSPLSPAQHPRRCPRRALRCNLPPSPDARGGRAGLPANASPAALDAALKALLLATCSDLAKSGLAAPDEDGFSIAPTPCGREVSRFYVRLETFKRARTPRPAAASETASVARLRLLRRRRRGSAVLAQLPPHADMGAILMAVASSSELAWIKARRRQRQRCPQRSRCGG